MHVLRSAEMLNRTLRCLLSFLVICGCSTTEPTNEGPSCGQAINPETVSVVDAEHLFEEQDINTLLNFVAEEVGSFQLISNSTFRADTWPARHEQPRWVHAQEAAASKGCDVLILVDSAMLRSKSRAGMNGLASPTLHFCFLMGFKAP